MSNDEHLRDLPGSEIVLAGIGDIEEGRQSEDALAVLMASRRLRAAGVDVPQLRLDAPASHLLYELLATGDPDGAHSRYNATVARVVSFARALEHAQSG